MYTVRPIWPICHVYTGHLVVKEATMSTLSRPLCLLHRPLSDEGDHYVHSEATLSFTQAT